MTALTRRAAASVVLGAVLSSGCSTGDRPVASPTTSDAAAESTASTTITTTTDAPDTAFDIPPLVTTPLDQTFTDWTAFRSNGTDLYGARGTGTGRSVSRLDPGTGAVIASYDTPLDSWTVTDDAVVLHDDPGRNVIVLEPDTLAVRHIVALPPDLRVAFQADTPRAGGFWLAAHRYDEDSVNGILTRMAAARIDLDAGTVAEIRDLPACGATSVVEQSTPGMLVAAISCAYQVVTVDTSTGALTEIEAFPSGAQLMRPDESVWIRWKPFGYLGRLQPGGDEIETLDLNIDGPTVADMNGLVGGAGAVWVVALTGGDNNSRVLNKIDLDTFEVAARATTTAGSIAFVGDVGYTAEDGRLVRFDTSSVTGGRPTRTVRPRPGSPPPVVPTNDDERSVVEAFSKVFDPNLPDDGAAPHLGDAPDLLDIRGRLTQLVADLYPGVELVVSAVAVAGDSASLAYSYLKDGKVAFIPLYGSMTRVGGVWVVDRAAVCQVASQAGIANC